MRFFNFGNDETFHCFVWLTDGGVVDTKELVGQALNSVEGDTWYENGSDVSTVAAEKLASLLKTKLEERIVDYDADVEDACIGDVSHWGESDRDKTRGLFVPILSAALERIDYEVLAEALLVAHGKWNPDRELPKLR